MNRTEILHYLRTNSKVDDKRLLDLIDDCCNEVNKCVRPKTIHRIFDCTVNDDEVIVENQVFDKLNFRTSSIVSWIDAQGNSIITTLYDRGKKVFSLEEENTYTHLRNVKITVFYLNTYTKRYFAQQTGFRSIDFGSIFLFVNGFRIPPYGDQGDDWLGIERRKSSGYRRYLSTREVIGRIEVNDDNNEFNIITNRAGVVHNSAFEELSREGSPYGFFYKTFRRLERFVVEGINWDKTGNVPSENAKRGYLNYA